MPHIPPFLIRVPVHASDISVFNSHTLKCYQPPFQLVPWHPKKCPHRFNQKVQRYQPSFTRLLNYNPIYVRAPKKAYLHSCRSCSDFNSGGVWGASTHCQAASQCLSHTPALCIYADPGAASIVVGCSLPLLSRLAVPTMYTCPVNLRRSWSGFNRGAVLPSSTSHPIGVSREDQLCPEARSSSASSSGSLNTGGNNSGGVRAPAKRHSRQAAAPHTGDRSNLYLGAGRLQLGRKGLFR